MDRSEKRVVVVATGRSVTGDPDALATSGEAIRVGDPAREHGSTDTDDSLPEPFATSDSTDA